jgi:hypothetical protein
VGTCLEPRFNNEPHAEVGHAFENHVLGGMTNCRTDGGLWLRQWPVAGRLNDYDRRVFRNGIYAPSGSPGERWVDERVYARFLDDRFWDTETAAAPGDRPCKPFKKLWLRPYHEVPTTPQEYNYYMVGHREAPVRGNQAKRRRLEGTRGGCPRWEDKRVAMWSTSEKSSRVQAAFSWPVARRRGRSGKSCSMSVSCCV